MKSAALLSFSAAAMVGLGGAIGAMLRYWMSARLSAAEWPSKGAAGAWAILIVNILGCLAFGLLQGWARSRPEPHAALFCLTGVLGGFTTFSTFGWDTYHFISQGKWAWAAANALTSVAGGVLAVALGVWLAKAKFGS
jgi:fluoride exporter